VADSRKFVYDQVLDFKTFHGLNIAEPPGKIKDNQLTTAVNYLIGRDGGLVKRGGYVERHSGGGVLGANAVNILGRFETDTVEQLIVRAGNDVYYSADMGLTFTVMPGGPWGNVEFGVQYVNKFYMVRSDATLIEWNGVAATAIAGSPFGTHCRVFKDRLFVLNTKGIGTLSSRLYFSLPGDFSAAGWVSTNFIDVNPGDGDRLTSQHNTQEILLLFKSSSSWALYAGGEPSTWVLRNLSPEIGCTSKYTTHDFENYVYFLSTEGVYRTTGTSLVSISGDIEPAFLDQQTVPAFLNKSTGVVYEDMYILALEFYPSAPTWGSWEVFVWNQLGTYTWDTVGAQYKYYVYHFASGTWTEWIPAPGTDFTAGPMLDVDCSADHRGLYIGTRTPTGKIFRIGTPVYQDQGQNYPCVAKTKEFDFDQLSFMKKSKWLAIESTGAGTMVVDILPEKGTVTQRTITTKVDRQMDKVSGPGYFRTLQIRSTFVSTGPHILYGYAIRFRGKALQPPNTVAP
jgi:hypothetical protein